jgi:hypothetical protein
MNMSWYFFKHFLDAGLWMSAIGISATIQYYLNPKSHSIFTTVHDRSFSSYKMFVAAIKMYHPQYLIVFCQIIVFQDKFDLLLLCAMIILVPIVLWAVLENNREDLENRLLWILNLFACCIWGLDTIAKVLKTAKN